MSNKIEILSTKWAYIIYDRKKYITIYCPIFTFKGALRVLFEAGGGGVDVAAA